MLCPNCMSPYVRPYVPELAEGEVAEPTIEPLFECTECEYVGEVTEFRPENLPLSGSRLEAAADDGRAADRRCNR